LVSGKIKTRWDRGVAAGEHGWNLVLFRMPENESKKTQTAKRG
jgi:hypothetical protein